MRVAILQINPTVGDLAGNARRILAAHARAAALGADLAVAPELALVGYPPKDLLDRPHFVDDVLGAFAALVPRVRGPGLVVGTIERNPGRGKPLFNVAALVEEGRVLSRHAKCLLPTYDVFDESRYFEPAVSIDPAVFRGRRLGISVCEDMWTVPAAPESAAGRRDPAQTYQTDPVRSLAEKGAEVIVNLSASPFTMGKPRAREDLLRAHVLATGRPMLFVNQVGGNDDLVFDGNSLALAADGRRLAAAGGFVESLLVVDPENPAATPVAERLEDRAGTGPLEAPVRAEHVPPLHGAVGGGSPALSEVEGGPRPATPEGRGTEPPPTDVTDVYQALVLGTRDYLRKCGFTKAVVGLSGGVDSALVACIAADAVGPKNVLGVSMPSRYSSEGSRTDAWRLAANLGIEYQVIPIDGIFTSTLDALRPAFEGRPADVTEENLQARIRGAVLMALSNKLGHLLLTTGNKSETAAGYCTLYGDMCGGLAVISDVPKTLVYRLSREVVNRDGARIPESSILKPPSAELRPDQRDSDSLPEYDVLDPILKAYVEEGLAPEAIAAGGHDEATVRRVAKLVDGSEYKRRQAAPGLKVTDKAFGSGRRYPIAQSYKSTAAKGS